MPDLSRLAHVYHLILTGFVRDGHAPHFTDLAVQLGTGHDAAAGWRRRRTVSPQGTS
jgi:hypothetical protein